MYCSWEAQAENVFLGVEQSWYNKFHLLYHKISKLIWIDNNMITFLNCNVRYIFLQIFMNHAEKLTESRFATHNVVCATWPTCAWNMASLTFCPIYTISLFQRWDTDIYAYVFTNPGQGVPLCLSSRFTVGRQEAGVISTVECKLERSSSL